MPMPGMTGAYVRVKPECCLRIEVVSYKHMSNGKGLVDLKVIKDLNKDSGCPYKEGEIFQTVISFNGENGLEKLILDSI